jgi:hypothetical protein
MGEGSLQRACSRSFLALKAFQLQNDERRTTVLNQRKYLGVYSITLFILSLSGLGGLIYFRLRHHWVVTCHISRL